MLLKCENKGEKVSDVKVNGDGCLSKLKGVEILMCSKSSMWHDALHAADDVL